MSPGSPRHRPAIQGSRSGPRTSLRTSGRALRRQSWAAREVAAPCSGEVNGLAPPLTRRRCPRRSGGGRRLGRNPHARRLTGLEAVRCPSEAPKKLISREIQKAGTWVMSILMRTRLGMSRMPWQRSLATLVLGAGKPPPAERSPARKKWTDGSRGRLHGRPWLRVMADQPAKRGESLSNIGGGVRSSPRLAPRHWRNGRVLLLSKGSATETAKQGRRAMGVRAAANQPECTDGVTLDLWPTQSTLRGREATN